jgi:hypothetical protein
MDHNIAHVEQLEIRDLRMDQDGTMVGSTEVMGLPMHITLIRVKLNDNRIQIADGHPLAKDRFEDLCKLDQRGPFATAQLEGYDGEWTWFLHPYSEG